VQGRSYQGVKLNKNFIEDFVRGRYGTNILGQPADDGTRGAGTAKSENAVGSPPAMSDEPIGPADDIKIRLAKARSAETARSRILSAYSVLERVAAKLAPRREDGSRVSFREGLREAAQLRGAPGKKLERDLYFILALRGRVLKGEFTPTAEEQDGYFRAIERILRSLGFDFSRAESA
jgi:hypothetical protein